MGGNKRSSVHTEHGAKFMEMVGSKSGIAYTE
jgi:hypothetical protein